MYIKRAFSLVYSILLLFSTISIFIPNIVTATNIKNSAVIFMYHKFNISKYPSTNITLEQFEDHLTELSKSKYNIKSIDFIIDTIINDAMLPKNTIGISIDDADRSFLDVGWPAFKKLGFPVVLFVSTKTISPNNKNYLNWDEIRQLQDEGVVIGGHSHTHSHLAGLNIEQIKNDIETSNRIFLKEIGKIPTLFAYPYGEANLELMNLLKNYKYKVAFGQHSGVINETSNMYYLPRFSLNEKYGDLPRIKFIANSKGLGVYDFIPKNPYIIDNPPYIGFSLLDQKLSKNINCFIFDQNGQVDNDLYKFNERIEIRINRKLTKGRSRLNCTTKDSNDNWRWFGKQFFINNN